MNLVLASQRDINRAIDDNARLGSNANGVLDAQQSTFLQRQSDMQLYLNLPGTYQTQRPNMPNDLDLKFRNKRGNMEVQVGVDILKHLVPDFAPSNSKALSVDHPVESCPSLMPRIKIESQFISSAELKTPDTEAPRSLVCFASNIVIVTIIKPP